MRRDYYIIDIENLDDKSRGPVFIREPRNQIHTQPSRAERAAALPFGTTRRNDRLQLQTEFQRV